MEYGQICATKITIPDDGRVLIEFFDYRSGDSLEPLGEAISKSLNTKVQDIPYCRAEDLPKNEFGDPIVSKEFEWKGSTFKVTWQLEFGSHIEGAIHDRQSLEELGRIFVGAEQDEPASPLRGKIKRARGWLERLFWH